MNGVLSKKPADIRQSQSMGFVTRAGLPNHLTPHDVIVLGPAWAGNSVNCVPFRVGGLLSRRGVRHCAYYDPAGHIVVARVVSGSQIVARHVLVNSQPPIDAHRAISLGFDREERLHLAFGAHNSTLFVARANGSDIEGGFDGPGPLDDPLGLHITYPMFLSPPGSDELILLFRDGSAADGELRIKRFDLTAHRWRDDPRPIVTGRRPSGPRVGPYVNTPAYGPGGEIVLFLVWRHEAGPSDPDAVHNIGIDCIVSKDGLRTLMTAAHEPLSVPVSEANATRIISVPVGANLINQASAAVRIDGAPMVVTYWDAGDGVPQYRLVWRDGRTWRVSTVSRFRTPFRLHGRGTLPLPQSRPEIVVGRDGRVHIIFRSQEYNGRLMLVSLDPPDYALASARDHVLVDQDLGFYEPVVDKPAWAQDDTLSVYVQNCTQWLGGDEITHLSVAEARVLSWREEQFA